MTQRIALINGKSNQNCDADYTALVSCITKDGGICCKTGTGWGTFEYSGGSIDTGVAFIPFDRTISPLSLSTQGLAVFYNDAPVLVPNNPNSAVWIEIDPVLLADPLAICDINGSVSFAQGLNIAKINYGPSFPTDRPIIKLYSFDGAGTPVDERECLKIGNESIDFGDILTDIETRFQEIENIIPNTCTPIDDDYTVLPTDDTVVYNGTGGHTVTLDGTMVIGKWYAVKNSSAGNIVVGSTLNIDGSATDIQLSSQESVIVKFDGTEIHTISDYKTTGITNAYVNRSNLTTPSFTPGPGAGLYTLLNVPTGFLAKTVDGRASINFSFQGQPVNADLEFYYSVAQNRFYIKLLSFVYRGSGSSLFIGGCNLTFTQSTSFYVNGQIAPVHPNTWYNGNSFGLYVEDYLGSPFNLRGRQYSIEISIVNVTPSGFDFSVSARTLKECTGGGANPPLTLTNVLVDLFYEVN